MLKEYPEDKKSKHATVRIPKDMKKAMHACMHPKDLPTNSDTLDTLVPQDLILRIEELIEKRPELPYADADEFIRDAIRRFILKRRKR